MYTRSQSIPLVGTVLGLMICVSIAENIVAKHGLPGFIDDALVILTVLLLSTPWVILAAEDRPLPNPISHRPARVLVEIVKWASFGFVSPILTLAGVLGMVLAFFAALRG
jgi:hypothetical protein